MPRSPLSALKVEEWDQMIDVAFAIEQPGDVDASEIIVRPTASPN
jgi:hypothetical protein